MNMNMTKPKNKSKKLTDSPIGLATILARTMRGKLLENHTRQSATTIIKNLCWSVNGAWFSAMTYWEELPVNDPKYGRLFELLDEIKCLTAKYTEEIK